MNTIDFKENEHEITELLFSTNRTGMLNLVACMKENGFFESPCSGGFHLCEKGGLAEHTLNVYRYAVKIAKAILSEDEFADLKEEITIASLLHDLGKMGDFGKSGYVPNYLKTGKTSATKPFKVNKELLNVPHSVRSVKIASQFIALTEDEEFAILMHDGIYGEMKYSIQGNETRLFQIIHMADFWCARFVEESECHEDNA